ncbi:Uncharacterised protein [Prevotella nigrescens]|nr:Uncharacterised protein [Prevotella nigrescens]
MLFKSVASAFNIPPPKFVLPVISLKSQNNDELQNSPYV